MGASKAAVPTQRNSQLPSLLPNFRRDAPGGLRMNPNPAIILPCAGHGLNAEPMNLNRKGVMSAGGSSENAGLNSRIPAPNPAAPLKTPGGIFDPVALDIGRILAASAVFYFHIGRFGQYPFSGSSEKFVSETGDLAV
jgi:hypothetical protein